MGFQQQAVQACKGMPDPVKDVKQLKEVARLASRLARSQEKTAKMLNMECLDYEITELLEVIRDLKVSLY